MKYTTKKLDVCAGIVHEHQTRIARRGNRVARPIPGLIPADEQRTPADPAPESDIDNALTRHPGTT
ncbi:MAG TPA: hypothetical protein VHL34_10185 [Rhizomicrobium sp.]|jgi:hypothetical protein|nr:hypothetical protein [Rhizomicrobium sp.]